MAARKYRKGDLPYEFVPMPKAILRSNEWHDLPSSVKALTFDLMAQYTGKNNGRLCPSFEVMQRCGWNSSHTLIKAKRALLECSFAGLTRKGHPPRTAEWIGFTWWKLDWQESMDIGPKGLPYLNFIVIAASPVMQQLHAPKSNATPGRADTAPMPHVRAAR